VYLDPAAGVDWATEIRMRNITSTALILLTLTAAAGAEVTVSVRASGSSGAGLRNEARLADWNSPLGRLSYFMGEQHANLLRGNQPGASGAVAFLVKAQSGQPLQLIASSIEDGVRLSETQLTQIPWTEKDSDEPEGVPLDEQLAILLSQRLQPK
jgi:hypothetical protein